MKQDGSIALFQYWNRLRDGRPAPKRTEIEPSDIKTLLADTFILEKDTRGEAIFRLAGTRLCAIYGRELKGFSFPSLWREKDQRLVARLVHGVFEAKAVVVVAFEGMSKNRRSNAFEMLILPLDGGVENPRCLGAMSAGEKPFWLGRRSDCRSAGRIGPRHRSGPRADVPEQSPRNRCSGSFSPTNFRRQETAVGPAVRGASAILSCSTAVATNRRRRPPQSPLLTRC